MHGRCMCCQRGQGRLQPCWAASGWCTGWHNLGCWAHSPSPLCWTAALEPLQQVGRGHAVHPHAAAQYMLCILYCVVLCCAVHCCAALRCNSPLPVDCGDRLHLLQLLPCFMSFVVTTLFHPFNSAVTQNCMASLGNFCLVALC